LTTLGRSKFLRNVFAGSRGWKGDSGAGCVRSNARPMPLSPYLNDHTVAADEYEFAIHLGGSKQTAQAVAGTPARLKIAARIDGSDRIKITQTR